MSMFGGSILGSEKTSTYAGGGHHSVLSVESSLLMEEERRSRLVATSRKYNDVFFLFLFVFHLVVILAVAIVFGVIAVSNEGSDVIVIKKNGVEIIDHSNEGLTRKIVGGIFLSLLTSATMSSAWIFFLSKFASVAVTAMLTMTVVIIGTVSLIMLYQGLIISGSLAFVVCVLIVAGSIYMKPRLDFAAANLSVACEAILQLPWTIMYSIIGQVLQIAFIVIWSIAIIGYATNYYKTTKTYHGHTYNLDSCTSYTYYDSLEVGSVTLTCSTPDASCKACMCGGEVISYKACFSSQFYPSHYVLLLVSLFWTCATLSNVVHCTTSAAVASWWANDRSDAVIHSAFQRSLSSSLGSICCGSLLVALVRTVRTVVSTWVNYIKSPSASSLASSGVNALSGSNFLPSNGQTRVNTVTKYLLAMLEYALSVLDRVIVYFNRYAFCYVAIYGLDFVKSSRAAAGLFMSKGWTTLFNDDIIDLVLHMGHVMVGCVSTLVSYMYAKSVSVGYTYQTILMLLGFLGGYLSSLLTLSVISSAVSTIYICYAENPTIFETFHPQTYHQLETAWLRMFEESSGNGGTTLGMSLLSSLQGSMRSSTATTSGTSTAHQQQREAQREMEKEKLMMGHSDMSEEGGQSTSKALGVSGVGGGSILMSPAAARATTTTVTARERFERGEKNAGSATSSSNAVPGRTVRGSFGSSAAAAGTSSPAAAAAAAGAASSSSTSLPLSSLPGWSTEENTSEGGGGGVGGGGITGSGSSNNIAGLVDSFAKVLNTAGTYVVAGASAAGQAAQQAASAAQEAASREGGLFEGMTVKLKGGGGSREFNNNYFADRDKNAVGGSFGSSSNENSNRASDGGFSGRSNSGRFNVNGDVDEDFDTDGPPSPVRGGWGPSPKSSSSPSSSKDGAGVGGVGMDNSYAF